MININNTLTMQWVMCVLTVVSYLGSFVTVVSPDPRKANASSNIQIELVVGPQVFAYVKGLILLSNLILLGVWGWDWMIFLFIFIVNPIIWKIISAILFLNNNLTYIVGWPDWTFWLMNVIGLLIVLGIAYGASFGGIYPLSTWLAPPQPSSNS